MRAIAVILAAAAFVVAATPAQAGPVNPVFNGGFEVYVPLVAVAAKEAGLDRSVGVGHQVMGCGHLAQAVWERDCKGAPVAREAALVALASNPNDEADYWLSDKAERGDAVLVNPAHSSAFHAANWGQYPAGVVQFRDVDVNLDREAVVVEDKAFLYQTFAATSTHALVPMGFVDALTFRLEAGSFDGASFEFVLDSFPAESVADWPHAFYNYQLSVPASLWQIDADGVVRIDPLLGTLRGPAPGAYIAPGLDSHPTPAQWNAATPEERRAMLMEFRAVQISFWSLPLGMILDDVAMELTIA